MLRKAIILLALLGFSLVNAQKLDEENLQAQITEIQNRLAKRIRINGFISQGWLKSTDNNFLADTDDGSFEFNEVGLNFGAQLSDSLHVGVQLSARDLGSNGNNKVEVSWAYGDYYFRDWLGFRGGRFRLPVGQYNETRDVDALRTSVLLPQSNYSELYRDVMTAVTGLNFYGSLPLSALGDFSYQTWLGGMSFDEDGAMYRMLESTGFFNMDDISVDYVFGVSLEWMLPVDGFRLTGSFMRIEDFDVEMTTTVLGGIVYGVAPGTTGTRHTDHWDITTFGGEYTWDRLTLAAERIYQRARSFEKIGSLAETNRSTRFEGYYGMVTYQLSDRLGVGASYSEFYIDSHDRDGDDMAAMGQPNHRGWQKDASLFARYDITENFVVKFEYHYIDGTALLLASDNPDGFEETWEMVAFKLSYSF